MGIDMYLFWDGQTEDERENAWSGKAGYLREAYWGGPYATSVLAPESWGEYDDGEPGVRIAARTLADRMEAVAFAVKERWESFDQPEEIPRVLANFVAFVELAKTKERETGKPCRVYCSY